MRAHTIWGWLIGVSLTVATVLPARANPIFEDGESIGMGYAAELGLVEHFGMSEFSSIAGDVSPSSRGIVLKDRHGLTSRVVMAALIMFGGAAAASSPKSVESSSRREGNYIVTTTKTTYRSQAEQQAIMAASAGAAAGIFSAPMAEFELELFHADRFGFGDSTGHKVNMLFGGGERSLYFEAGFGWGDVNSVVQKDGMTIELDHKYFGMPFRLGGAAGPVNWTATWEWNWLAHGVEDAERELSMLANGNQGATVAYHPLKVDLQMSLIGKVYGQVGVVSPQPTEILKFDLGYRASAGFRF